MTWRAFLRITIIISDGSCVVRALLLSLGCFVSFSPLTLVPVPLISLFHDYILAIWAKTTTTLMLMVTQSKLMKIVTALVHLRLFAITVETSEVIRP